MIQDAMSELSKGAGPAAAFCTGERVLLQSELPQRHGQTRSALANTMSLISDDRVSLFHTGAAPGWAYLGDSGCDKDTVCSDGLRTQRLKHSSDITSEA